MDLALKKTRVLEFQNIFNGLKCDDSAPLPCQLWPTPVEFRQDRKDLQTSIQFIKGVGPRLSEILRRKTSGPWRMPSTFFPGPMRTGGR